MTDGSRAKSVYLSDQADPRLAGYFRSEGYSVIPVRTAGLVSDPLACHPDLFMCRMGASEDSELIVYPGLFGEERGCFRLSPEYPLDVPYNAACTGRFFIHNLNYTAPELIEAAQKAGMILIDVRQGYTKCSTVVVDDNSIITYDKGIAMPCRKSGMNVLQIEAGHIALPGYDTGFIGGTSGRFGNTVYFNGDLTAHPDHEAIIDFIEKRGLDVRWFEEWPLTDIGSII